MVRLTGARAGAIRAPTADASQLRLIASVGLASGLCERDAVMPASCGMCGAALQSALTRQATRRIGCKVLDEQNSAGGARGRDYFFERGFIKNYLVSYCSGDTI